MPSIFFLGATGYVGGSLFVALRKQRPDLHITAAVRSESAAAKITAAGATAVVVSNDEHEIISQLAEKADLVLDLADSDNFPIVEDVLRGLKRKFEAGRGRGIFVHTSGAAIFLDGKLDGTFGKPKKVLSVRYDF